MKKRIVVLIAVCLLLCCSVVYADTDGTEPQVMDQPSKLVLQLGPEWAGVSFELQTDAGQYPEPIVVDDTGVLAMELGSSKTYTLSCFGSHVPAPVPNAQPQPSEQSVQTSNSPAIPDDEVPSPEPSQHPEERGIPTTHFVLFLGGLAVCVGALIAMCVHKKRRQQREDGDDWDDV